MRLTPIALALNLIACPLLVLAQTSETKDTQTLDTVNVTATADSPADLPPPYAGGQVSQGTRLGTLGNQNVMDTPFSVTGYTEQLIEDQQARTVADVLANDPSVRYTTSNGHAYENYRLRGFDVNANDLALNGMFGLAPKGHTPVEFLERVEVLKGPSALFSGMPPGGSIGGVINLVPKRATDDPLTRVSFGYLSNAQPNASVDIGRRFGTDKEWGIRANGAWSEGDTTLDGQAKRRQFGSLALDYRGAALKASLDTYYSNEAFFGGTPAMYWFGNTTKIPGAANPHTNLFPNAYGNLESKAVIAHAEYTINPHLTIFGGVGYQSFNSFGFINGTHARLIAANGNFTASTNVTRGYTETVSSEAGLRSRFATGEIGHEVVLQATDLEQKNGSATASATNSSNIYNENYNLNYPQPPGFAPKTSKNILSSVALIDALSFLDERVLLTLGGRLQRVQTYNYSTTTGATTTSYDKNRLSPSVGLVVKPWGPHLSLYASYVEGLSQGDTVSDTLATNYQKVFAPYKTEQKEIGVKWDAGKLTNTLALYELKKPNLVATGAATRPTYSDDGEKRVRGIEWEAFGELVRNLRLLGGITYAQGEQTKTAYNQYNGKNAIGVPRWQGNLGSEWDTPWLLHGLTFSGRVNVTSKQWLDAANTQEIAGFTTIDAGVRYTTQIEGRKTVFRLNVNNLLNRYYWSGSFSDSYPIATLGAPRSISASATVDF